MIGPTDIPATQSASIHAYASAWTMPTWKNPRAAPDRKPELVA